MKFNAFIFDLDGTILDTLWDLRDSVNFALEHNGLPCRSTEEIRAFVGNGIRLLIERAVSGNTDAKIIDKCFADFKEHYKLNSANSTRAYDGVIDVLLQLKNKGAKLCVVSNKADFAVQTLVEQYFSGVFDFAVGEKEGVRRKPFPDSVYTAMEYIGADKSKTVYIGDSEVDVETAVNSQVPCIAVTWGFRDKNVLEALNPEYIIDDPKQILDFIE